MKNKVLIFCTHPIQYIAPLFKFLSNEIDIDVIYFSDHGTKDRYVKGLGEIPAWDIDLLSGYSYRFIKNYSPKPNVNTFWGLINLGIIRSIKDFKGTYVWINGWSNISNLLVVFISKLNRKKILLRSEATLIQELRKTKAKLYIKKLLLKFILFKLIDYFLYIGNNNKNFYKFYGITENRLIFAPYCVDNDRFSEKHLVFNKKKNELKLKYNLPTDNVMFLFVGKFVEKKRPLVLLKAFIKLRKENCSLVFVGAGPQEKKMREMIRKYKTPDVYILGYKNQTELPEIYALSDIFVLPSGEGETWGLVVNEAMNFRLAIITSDLVGCSEDLVRNNGVIFKLDDTYDLIKKINMVLDNDRYKTMGQDSFVIVKEYSYFKVKENLRKLLDENINS